MQIHITCGSENFTVNPDKHGKRFICYGCGGTFNYPEKVGESNGTRD